ncbi:MAG: protease modulator HflC [Paracoccaceae bacterium]|nr:protease modulator HflC [Paracoccaceae bacterium]
MKRSTILLAVLAAGLFILINSFYIVDARKKALVLQFGQVKGVKLEPGLFFKVPFIQNVVKYDGRILSLDTESLEVTPLDDRRLVVDAFARWRVQDVVRFRKAVGVGGIPLAERRLKRILTASTREVLGSVNSGDILSADRVKLMNRIRDTARNEAEALGVLVIDVRLKRTDLPEQNLSATFARMRAEREREAADEIARGKEAAQKVRAEADRTVVELTSEAQKNADITRGEADAKRNAIFAQAFGRDPEFFAFYRSLRAYETSLKGDNTTFVLNPDSEFFSYLKTNRVVPKAAVPSTGGVSQ